MGATSPSAHIQCISCANRHCWVTVNGSRFTFVHKTVITYVKNCCCCCCCWTVKPVPYRLKCYLCLGILSGDQVKHVSAGVNACTMHLDQKIIWRWSCWHCDRISARFKSVQRDHILKREIRPASLKVTLLHLEQAWLKHQVLSVSTKSSHPKNEWHPFWSDMIRHKIW